MRLEFSPYGWGGRRLWDLPFPAIDQKRMPAPELSPWGHCKVARIDNFRELKGTRGALLDWPWLKKKKFQMIVRIEHGEYREGGFVQIIREETASSIRASEPKLHDYRYWARPMPNRISQLLESDLNPATKEIFEKLDPVVVIDLF